MATDITNSVARPLVAVALFITACCAMPPSAKAQDGPPAECTGDESASNSLQLVRFGDSKTRAVAASSLISQWRKSLPTVMRELSRSKGPTERWQNDEASYFLSVTDILRTILSDNVEAITLFRSCSDPSIIRPLIWGARSDIPGIRLNPTLVLGNVVDNRSVCMVLHHLRDPKINEHGRANLLGVTLAVAGYAYAENVREILQTLTIITPRVEPNLTQTLKLMADISARAKTSSNGSESLPSKLAQPCATYNYDAERQ
jgi:hypothetical protein